MTITTESLTLAAYWGPRRESAAQCAERLRQCVDALAKTNRLLATWYRPNNTPIPTTPKVAWDQSSIVDLLLSGRNRRDLDQGVIEELGFRVSLWNGEPDDTSVGLSTHCGSYTTVPGILNTFILHLPARGPDHPDPDHTDAARLYGQETLELILRAVANAWSPDWAVVTTRALRKAQPTPTHAPFVGWMTFLSAGRPVPTVLPAGTEVERLDQGTLITLPDRPEAGSSRLAALALRDILETAGALAPTRAG